MQNSAFILIMHYSRVMPPSGDRRYFPSTAVFLHELIKLAVSLTLALYEASKTLAPSTPATVLFEQIYNAMFAGDGWKLVVPGVFYTLQNILQYVAIENLDAVHFQVLYQLKVSWRGKAFRGLVHLLRHMYADPDYNGVDSHHGALQRLPPESSPRLQALAVAHCPHAGRLHRLSPRLDNKYHQQSLRIRLASFPRHA